MTNSSIGDFVLWRGKARDTKEARTRRQASHQGRAIRGDRAKQIAALEAERVMLTAKLEASLVEENAIALHPAALARYESQLVKLQQVLAAGTAMGDTEAAAAIRDLVQTVAVRPHPDCRGGVLVEVSGRLNALLDEEPHRVSVCSESVGKLVAGRASPLPTDMHHFG